MPTIRIEVTAEDIANGVKQAACSCPIALAIRRARPDASYVEVDGDVFVELGGVHHYARLPGPAMDFVANFDAADMDRSMSPAPFAFEAEFEPRTYGYSDLDDA